MRLLGIAAGQCKVRQQDLRTRDRIQGNARQLARLVEHLHPVGEVFLLVGTAHPFLRLRDPERIGDLGRAHPEPQWPQPGSGQQLPVLPSLACAHVIRPFE